MICKFLVTDSQQLDLQNLLQMKLDTIRNLPCGNKSVGVGVEKYFAEEQSRSDCGLEYGKGAR